MKFIWKKIVARWKKPRAYDPEFTKLIKRAFPNLQTPFIFPSPASVPLGNPILIFGDRHDITRETFLMLLVKAQDKKCFIDQCQNLKTFSIEILGEGSAFLNAYGNATITVTSKLKVI